MILDTSYFMPLAKVEIASDLLLAVVEDKIQYRNLSFDLITLNSISLFELQAKAAKLRINNDSIIEALAAISTRFRIERYNSREIIETASSLRQNFFTDYIDCIIIATAIVCREELVTEDSKILRKRKDLLDNYSIEVLSYCDLVKVVS
jgi:predicted nucleic acid-binding protein